MKYLISGIILFIGILVASKQINATHLHATLPTNDASNQSNIKIRGNCFIDTDTNLMWARNPIIGFNLNKSEPDYNNNQPNLNLLRWKDVNPAIAKLNKSGNRLCGYNDWRLPDTEELNSLIIEYQADSSEYLSSKVLFNKPENGYWATSKNQLPMVVSFTDYVSTMPDRTGLSHIWLVRTYQESS